MQKEPGILTSEQTKKLKKLQDNVINIITGGITDDAAKVLTASRIHQIFKLPIKQIVHKFKHAGILGDTIFKSLKTIGKATRKRICNYCKNCWENNRYYFRYIIWSFIRYS